MSASSFDGTPCDVDDLECRLTSRTEVLKTLLNQSPNDAFVRYGLAMEYVNAGELELAVVEFREVLRIDPNYAYAYYHGGQTLEKLGEMDAARQLYEDGLTVTQRSGNSKAHSELQAALDILPL